MKLGDIHPTAKALLESDTQTASFAPVLVVDGINDFAQTIDEALQSKGVCIVLGEIVWDSASYGDIQTPIVATLYVNIFEQPKIAHSPSGYTLIDEVASALTKRHAFLAGRGQRIEDEKGATVTVQEFSTNVVLNQQ